MVLTPTSVNVHVFRSIAPCNLVYINRRFRVVYCFCKHSEGHWMAAVSNVGQYLPDYTAQHPRRQTSATSQVVTTKMLRGDHYFHVFAFPAHLIRLDFNTLIIFSEV
jgi:hypothetical protein